MKKALFILVAFTGFAFTAAAQHKRHEKGQHQKQQNMMMARELNLSEEQKKQAKTIHEDTRKKMQELNKNEGITVKEQRDRKAAIQKERKAKMDGLLTAEQKTKMAQLKADQKIKREEQYAKRLEKMKTNLSLTDEQVAKLKAQRASNQAKAEKIKNNEKLSREQKKEQMMALKTEAKEQRSKTFTPDQLKKMEEMKKNRGDRSRVKK